MLKTHQFINVVNNVSRSHKTANIFFSFDSGLVHPDDCPQLKTFPSLVLQKPFGWR